MIDDYIIKIIHCGLRWPPINVFDSTTNQKWVGAEEKRVEKRGKRGGVAEGCQCSTSACGRREGAMYRIVDNPTLLGHDAECHVPNTAMTASKIAGKLDPIYFYNIIELLVKIMSIINEIIFVLSTRKRGGAQQPHIAARAKSCPINGCVAISMGLQKMLPKPNCHGEVVVPW